MSDVYRRATQDPSVTYWDELATAEFEKMHRIGESIDERLQKNEPIGPLLSNFVSTHRNAAYYSDQKQLAFVRVANELLTPPKQSFWQKLFN